MAMGNFNLPFDQHNAQQRPIRNRPSRYAQTPLAPRFRFEVSEGTRPAEYMGVYKSLPALQKDVTTEDYIVLPKGRLVSNVTSEDSTPLRNMENPATSGQIYTFTSETTSTITSEYIDTSYYGYDEYISNLIVPANGGSAVGMNYTANDVAAGTITNSGTVAAAGEGFELPINYPVGALFHDIYQDIRGMYNNYRMWPDGQHVLCDWYVEVPYVKTTAGADTDNPLGSGVSPIGDNTYATWAAATRFAINDRFTYLDIKSDSDTFKPGVLIAPQVDGTGNYLIQGVGNKTIQTVGKLIGIDNRFPKAGMDDVQTYPGSDMPGTQTAGLPSFLFEFVVACQKLTGTTPTVEEVLGYVQAGYFGIARINLSIS